MDIALSSPTLDATASARIVVQATPRDKAAIAAKAKRLDMPLSELMRRGAFAYQGTDTAAAAAGAEAELAALADAAKAAADRSIAAIDDALAFIEASNRRHAAAQAKAAKAPKQRKAA